MAILPCGWMCLQGRVSDPPAFLNFVFRMYHINNFSGSM